MTDRESPETWDGNVNEAVLEEWIDSTTKFERVREVLLSTTMPQYAKEIGERARVSEPTARKHLETLAASGFGEVVTTGRGKRYKRSRQTVAMQRISETHQELSREELTEGIRELRERIRTYQNEFDASDPDDLAFQIESDEADAWKTVTAWRAAETDLDIAKAALALYDFDPDTGTGDGNTPENGDTSTSRGAFSDSTGNVSV